MKSSEKNNKVEEITRKEAIKKIGNYGKYAALTALGTYMILNPQKAQASSALLLQDQVGVLILKT